MALKEIVSEKTGHFSCTRVMMVVVILACVLWATILVIKTEITAIPDIPLQWAGLITLLYGINKLSGRINGG